MPSFTQGHGHTDGQTEPRNINGLPNTAHGPHFLGVYECQAQSLLLTLTGKGEMVGPRFQ